MHRRLCRCGTTTCQSRSSTTVLTSAMDGWPTTSQRQASAHLSQSVSRLIAHPRARTHMPVCWLSLFVSHFLFLSVPSILLTSAGILRRMVNEPHRGYSSHVWNDVNLAISAHKPDMICLFEHTDCAERGNYFTSENHRPQTADEEKHDILSTLKIAAAQLNKSMVEIGVEPLPILLLVGIVTPSHQVRHRRLERIMSAAEFQDMDYHPSP
jgi:hypothetical protein